MRVVNRIIAEIQLHFALKIATLQNGYCISGKNS